MTDTHDWYVEHREAYALGALDAADAALFADHLARCPECAAAQAALERDLAPLAFGVQPVAVPPGLRRTILDAVVGPRVVRSRPSRLPWLLAAAVTLAATGLGGRAMLEARRLRADLAAADARVEALADSLSIVTNVSRVMQAGFTAGGGAGQFVILADEASHRWRVVVQGPPAPDGMSYLVCFITPTGLRHAVTVGRGGRPSSFALGMPSDGTPVIGAALLLEPDVPRAGAELQAETPIAKVML